MAVIVVLGDMFAEAGSSLVEGEVLIRGTMADTILVPDGICRGCWKGTYYRGLHYTPHTQPAMWMLRYGVQLDIHLLESMRRLKTKVANIRSKDLLYLNLATYCPVTIH